MLSEHWNLGRQHNGWGSELYGTFSRGSLILLSKTVFENASSNVVCLLSVHRIVGSIGLPDADAGQDQDPSNETIVGAQECAYCVRTQPTEFDLLMLKHDHGLDQPAACVKIDHKEDAHHHAHWQ